MKQSDRMRMYLEYINHPLKEEYVQKKRGIKQRKVVDKWLICLKAIPFVLIFVFGYLFFATDDWNEMVCYLIVGAINLYVCVKVIDTFELHLEETDGLKDLKEAYKEKGLYEVDNPERAICGEYNDIYEMYVCSATQEPLSYNEKNWCNVPGNCKHCARFWCAMGYDPQEMSEIVEIRKW